MLVYTDDSAIFCDSYTDAVKNYDQMAKYCTLNKLSVNFVKTKVIKFLTGTTKRF